MIKWSSLDKVSAVHDLVEQSHKTPCLIFKHSTRCSISSMAKLRLESAWDFSSEEMEPYFLDLIANRDVSNFVAEHFEVYHESPQVLLVRNGTCTYDASHLDISVAELHECYESKF
ncbi:MAG: bacillithiol system redox-active protein YtxJ [Bacteroidota bacterium]